jgi:hypothetical protein
MSIRCLRPRRDEDATTGDTVAGRSNHMTASNVLTGVRGLLCNIAGRTPVERASRVHNGTADPLKTLRRLYMRRLYVLFALFAVALVAKPAAAQQADIIRGKIIGPDSQPILNASIQVMDLASGVTKQAKTNKDGRFNVVFPNGGGDFMIYVTAIGFTQKKYQIKRLADEEVLIADTKLAGATLETVNVVANAQRQTASRTDNTGDITGTDRGVNNGSVGAADAGNIAALAASIPGFQLIPGLDGNPDLFSALGLNPDQNGSSLNGAPGLGGDLPRDAATSTSVGTNSADVSQGGYSGAGVRTFTRSGTNYRNRAASGNADAPQLQWTDDVGEAVSSTYTRLSVGGSFDGPISLDRNFFNLSYQYDRKMQDAHNLFNTDPLGLRTAGVALDSVANLRGILSGLSIPMGTSGIPSDKISDQVKLQGVLDFQPKSPTSGHQFQLSSIANWTKTSAALSQGILTTSTQNGETSNLLFQTTFRHTNYFWDKIATETWITASLSKNQMDPYLAYPTGNVQVASELEDGSRSIKNLSFGGGQNQGSETRTSLLGFMNQMRWVAGNNRHALKFATEFRYDNTLTDSRSNAFGSFFFQSLADLEANRPSSYSRQLFPQTEDAGQFVAAVSLGDAWRPSINFQMQYGLRIDGNKFVTRPNFNPLVASQFGVRNDQVPNKVYLSPRAGFAWTYGQAPQIPYFEGFRPGQRATLRGMVGIFQNMSGPTAVSQAVQSTGLAGSSRLLICGGPATPTPDWDEYRFNPFSAPVECADGNSPFATNVPSVTMFDPSFQQQRTLRSNLNWTTISFGNRFNLGLSGTYQLGFKLPSAIDINFRPEERFILENEGGRPVYVNPTSIDPRFGSVATRDSRVSTDFNRISVNHSDLHQQSVQFTTSLRPVISNPTRFTWGVNYTYSDIRDEYYGFSSTVGNPLEKRWGVSGGQFAGGTHRIGYDLSYNFWDYFIVNWRGGFQSGYRYTPMVAGDVNGDNSGNDRAFVFDPASTNDPAVAAGMQSLLASGSSSARACLEKQRGRFAARNSCTGPWAATVGNLNITIQPIKLKLPPRAEINISISNPLSALDMALHGSDNVRGWGQTRVPEQSLLFVRGFDPTTRQYKYEVNERFGATGAQQSLRHDPVVVTLAVKLNIGPTRDWQSLKLSLDRGRKTTGNRVSEAQIKNTVSGSITNPMANILRSADVLGLTRRQADSLAGLSRGFTLVLDSIWSPVAKYYAGMDTVYRESDAQEKFIQGREAAVNYLIKVAPALKKLLTKSQLRRLGPNITNFLEPRYLERVRAGVVSSGIGFPIFF